MSTLSKKSLLKVVVKSKKKPKRKVGLPSLLVTKKVVSTTVEQPDDDEFPLDDFLPSVEDLPCDTLLLMRSIEQRRTCLYVPLQKGALIPTVLETQLYSKLNGEDSVVTQELHDLARSNQIRRLVPASDETLVAWIETRHYVRAVWDAHQSYSSDAVAIKVTTWFLSNLCNWTKRSITKEAMKRAWKDSGAVTLDQAIDMLVDMQVLLPSLSTTFLLWLPLWGAVLAAINKAQGKVVAHIKRSLYKELSVKTIEARSHFGGLAGSFVLHTLSTQGKIEVVPRPAGNFARIPK
jgi:hypothetical protein